jgi:hypothetical protein
MYYRHSWNAYGPSSCSQTYLACALAHPVCLLGFIARYFHLPRL